MPRTFLSAKSARITLFAFVFFASMVSHAVTPREVHTEKMLERLRGDSAFTQLVRRLQGEKRQMVRLVLSGAEIVRWFAEGRDHVKKKNWGALSFDVRIWGKPGDLTREEVEALAAFDLKRGSTEDSFSYRLNNYLPPFSLRLNVEGDQWAIDWGTEFAAMLDDKPVTNNSLIGNLNRGGDPYANLYLAIENGTTNQASFVTVRMRDDLVNTVESLVMLEWLGAIDAQGITQEFFANTSEDARILIVARLARVMRQSPNARRFYQFVENLGIHRVTLEGDATATFALPPVISSSFYSGGNVPADKEMLFKPFAGKALANVPARDRSRFHLHHKSTPFYFTLETEFEAKRAADDASVFIRLPNDAFGEDVELGAGFYANSNAGRYGRGILMQVTILDSAIVGPEVRFFQDGDDVDAVLLGGAHVKFSRVSDDQLYAEAAKRIGNGSYREIIRLLDRVDNFSSEKFKTVARVTQLPYVLDYYSAMREGRTPDTARTSYFTERPESLPNEEWPALENLLLRSEPNDLHKRLDPTVMGKDRLRRLRKARTMLTNMTSYLISEEQVANLDTDKLHQYVGQLAANMFGLNEETNEVSALVANAFEILAEVHLAMEALTPNGVAAGNVQIAAARNTLATATLRYLSDLGAALAVLPDAFDQIVSLAALEMTLTRPGLVVYQQWFDQVALESRENHNFAREVFHLLRVVSGLTGANETHRWGDVPATTLAPLFKRLTTLESQRENFLLGRRFGWGSQLGQWTSGVDAPARYLARWLVLNGDYADNGAYQSLGFRLRPAVDRELSEAATHCAGKIAKQ